MKPFLPLFPYIQSRYIAANYDRRATEPCLCGTKVLAEYRCTSCYLQPPCCAQCMIKSHRHLPFHRVEKWNGHYFQKITLHGLGYVFYLGHNGYPCPNQLSTASRRMIIVDINGYHEVDIMFCYRHDQETNEAKQLLHHLLFPATLVHPETAFTTEVLDQFDVHNCTSTKLAEAFCSALQKLTNADQPGEVSVRCLLCNLMSC